MNGGCVGGERMRGERVVDGEVKEAEHQMGVIAELKGDLRELR